MTLHAQTRSAASLQRRGFARKVPFLNIVFTLHAVWVERRRLARLDAHQLNDIGLSLDEAKDEARRKMWDAPERWRR